MQVREIALITETGTQFITYRPDGHFHLMRDADELVSSYKDYYIESIGVECINGQAYVKVNILW